MKQKRQVRIVELIRKYEIETQEELADRLREEGFAVTQATVSRDIRELKLSKVPVGNGRQKYAVFQSEEATPENTYIQVMRNGFLSMDVAQNIMVIRTVSGMAMAVAAAVDAIKFPEVVGCIAGDDTIMVAVRSAQDTDSLMEKILKMLG